MSRRLESAAREALVERRHVLRVRRHLQQVAENDLLGAREADIVDLASARTEASVLESLVAAELEELREIEGALDRIEGGTYGLCKRCGVAIDAPRLEVIPWTQLCIECSREF